MNMGWVREMEIYPLYLMYQQGDDLICGDLVKSVVKYKWALFNNDERILSFSEHSKQGTMFGMPMDFSTMFEGTNGLHEGLQSIKEKIKGNMREVKK